MKSNDFRINFVPKNEALFHSLFFGLPKLPWVFSEETGMSCDTVHDHEFTNADVVTDLAVILIDECNNRLSV